MPFCETKDSVTIYYDDTGRGHPFVRPWLVFLRGSVENAAGVFFNPVPLRIPWICAGMEIHRLPHRGMVFRSLQQICLR